VTFQQGCHGGQGGRFGSWGLPVHAAGCGAGSGAGGNCPFHSGIHNWEMHFANPHGPNYQPGFRPSVPGEDVETTWAAGDSRVAIKMSILRRIL
jgi:hypothetical protein